MVWELAPHGPVVAIGRPGRSRQPSVPPVITFLTTNGNGASWNGCPTWWGSPRSSSGRPKVSAGRSAKSLPPATSPRRSSSSRPPIRSRSSSVGSSLRRRWRQREPYPPLPVEPAQVLTAHLDLRHQWHVTGSPRRDEASYRAAVDQSMAWLLDQQRSDEPAARTHVGGTPAGRAFRGSGSTMTRSPRADRTGPFASGTWVRGRRSGPGSRLLSTVRSSTWSSISRDPGSWPPRGRG